MGIQGNNIHEVIEKVDIIDRLTDRICKRLGTPNIKKPGKLQEGFVIDFHVYNFAFATPRSKERMIKGIRSSQLYEQFPGDTAFYDVSSRLLVLFHDMDMFIRTTPWDEFHTMSISSPMVINELICHMERTYTHKQMIIDVLIAYINRRECK